MLEKRFLLRTLVGLTALIAASSVFARDMSIPYGWYVEGNLGSTYLSKKSYPGESSESGMGANANAGYKFIPYLAAEVGYTQYAYTTVNTNAGVRAAKDKHTSYDLALKGIYPIMQTGIEVFAKLGAAHIMSDMQIKNTTAANSLGLTENSHNEINAYFGGGAQYYFIPELALVVQWQRANGDSSTGTMDLFSGGLSFLVD